MSSQPKDALSLAKEFRQWVLYSELENMQPSDRTKHIFDRILLTARSRIGKYTPREEVDATLAQMTMVMFTSIEDSLNPGPNERLTREENIALSKKVLDVRAQNATALLTGFPYDGLGWERSMVTQDEIELHEVRVKIHEKTRGLLFGAIAEAWAKLDDEPANAYFESLIGFMKSAYGDLVAAAVRAADKDAPIGRVQKAILTLFATIDERDRPRWRHANFCMSQLLIRWARSPDEVPLVAFVHMNERLVGGLSLAGEQILLEQTEKVRRLEDVGRSFLESWRFNGDGWQIESLDLPAMKVVVSTGKSGVYGRPKTRNDIYDLRQKVRERLQKWTSPDPEISLVVELGYERSDGTHQRFCRFENGEVTIFTDNA